MKITKSQLKQIIKEELGTVLREEKSNLFRNIRAKRARGEPPAKSGEEDYPSEKSWKKATKKESIDEDGGAYYEMLAEGETLEEAEYQGRKVTLNKPTKGDVKKSKVYVKNAKGNVVKVNFGDPNMKIKKNIPARRKSFRARHNCKNPGPKWKARYWSCKAW